MPVDFSVPVLQCQIRLHGISRFSEMFKKVVLGYFNVIWFLNKHAHYSAENHWFREIYLFNLQ